LRTPTKRPRSAVTFAIGLLLAWTAAGNAAGPYAGFKPPTTSVAPAGFQSTVQTATTIRVSGGKLTVPVIRGARVTVNVPAHAFSVPVQVAITQPSLSALKSLLHRLGYPRYEVATGFALVVSRQNGSIITGTFSKPLTVEVRGSRIGVKREKVLSVKSLTSATALTVKRSAGKVTLSIRKGSDLIVANPSSPKTLNT
jgi:hypothetical protein